MSLVNIYNERYGSVVATNGSFIAIGNPPTSDWNYSEGFGRIGEVVIVKKNNYINNYSVVKNLRNSYSLTEVNPYYTEQSASTANTSSLAPNSGSLPNVKQSCSFLTIETGNKNIYQSHFGEALDLSDYFLAVSDLSFSQSLYKDYFVSKNSVNVYEINPNYTVDTSLQNIIIPSQNISNSENLDTYTMSDNPICFITGSTVEQFGKSVSISNNYLVIGAPSSLNGRGKVYIYKYANPDCLYTLNAVISSSLTEDPNQNSFGYSVSIDKYSESKILVGSNQLSGGKVFLFQSGSNGWRITQRFENLTSSNYLKIEGQLFELEPSGSLSAAQKNNNFGKSVSIHKNTIVIGSPLDLLYYEYSGSSLLRQRGAAYVYTNDLCITGSAQYTILSKTYGDDKTFKDNMFGYSVSTYNGQVLIGSPKPYFPFGSLYASSSINKFDKYFNVNDFGESGYCGQSCLYIVSGSGLVQLTTDPISKRKNYKQPYNAYGSSVSLSDINLVIGAPIPLNKDLYLSAPLITESGSLSDPSYVLTSSYNPEECNLTSDVIYFSIEDTVYADGNNLANIAIKVEDEVIDEIKGRAYVYDFADLQTDAAIGNVFYNNNNIVINNTGSIFGTFTRDPVNPNLPYIHMEYQSQISLYEQQYVCKVEPGEFNISTNPTAITSSIIDYGIFNKSNFDFNNLDIILRFINYKITSPRSEEWWNTFISSDVEQSIFGFYTSSFQNYNSNRLTEQLKYVLATKDFDVNKDGTVSIQDGTMIWKYFSGQLNYTNYKNYINPLSRRNNYDDIVNFLNTKTGKFNTSITKPEFFSFHYSSSLDPTGSYLAPYITQVGLYSGADLVALAKLAQPIKNTGEIPINIIVKWDT